MQNVKIGLAISRNAYKNRVVLIRNNTKRTPYLRSPKTMTHEISWLNKYYPVQFMQKMVPSLLKPCLLLGLLTRQAPVVELELEEPTCVMIIKQKTISIECWGEENTDLLLFHWQIIHAFDQKVHIPLHKWVGR